MTGLMKHDTGIKSTTDQYLFNPFEISFCGCSNAGKTTLITSIIRKLSSTYSVGYIKHDSHAFQMDCEGKDTDKAWKSGAEAIFIVDASHSAQIVSGPVDRIRQKTSLLNCDMVLVEGFKKALISKIVVVDKDKKILEMYQNGLLEGVVAFVGQEKSLTGLPMDVPYFHRDDIDGIGEFVLSRFKDKIRKIPLYGLVLAGGHSKRMQEDKSLISYHGRPQAEVCYKLLSETCDKAYLSTRAGQWRDGQFSNLPQLQDRFLDIGPLGGILTAMMSHPKAAWMVVACDLPYLDQATLQTLFKGRNPFKTATAFQNAEKTFPEPLCTIYEPKSNSRLLQGFGVGLQCPREILINSPIQLLTLSHNNLENVNDQIHRAKIAKQLDGTRIHHEH